MRRLKCLFRRHQWRSEHHHDDHRTTWECRRCGARRRSWGDVSPDVAAGGGGA